MVKKKSFTLIELIVVVAIIAVVSSVSLVSFSKLTGDRLTADARKIVSDLCWARQMAVAGNQYIPVGLRQNYIVVFDTFNETYTLFQGSTNPANRIKSQVLGRGVDLVSVVPATPTGLTFTFPQGTLMEAGTDWTITLNSQGKTRQVRIFRDTGYVRMQ